MKRLGIALSAGLLFAVASLAAPAGAQLQLLDGVTESDGSSEESNPLSGLLDSVEPDVPVVDEDAVVETVKKTADPVLPDSDEPDPDPDDTPTPPAGNDGAANNDAGSTPAPRGKVDQGAPAPVGPGEAIGGVRSLPAAEASSGGSDVFAAGTDASVAGTTVVSDSVDLEGRKAEAQAAANLPVGDDSSPFGPIQFVAVMMVAAVMCAEFLYGVRRSTGEVLRA